MRVVTRIKGVNAVRAKLASGEKRVFYYHRATGTRLPDDPASPAFLAAWREAEASMRPARPGTLATLIDQYRDSTKFQALRESTRRVAVINLNSVAAKFGTMPLAALAGVKRGSATTILTAPNGRPWTSDAFGKAWKAAYKEAYKACNPAPDLHFHDLRGTAVTRLAEAGCTIPQIAAITGHKPQSAERILSAYLAMTPDLARSAIARLDEHARNRNAK